MFCRSGSGSGLFHVFEEEPGLALRLTGPDHPSDQERTAADCGTHPLAVTAGLKGQALRTVPSYNAKPPPQDRERSRLMSGAIAGCSR
jgi:hypothetical protein